MPKEGINNLNIKNYGQVGRNEDKEPEGHGLLSTM